MESLNLVKVLSKYVNLIIDFLLIRYKRFLRRINV